jgi:hypothetical protein
MAEHAAGETDAARRWYDQAHAWLEEQERAYRDTGQPGHLNFSWTRRLLARGFETEVREALEL